MTYAQSNNCVFIISNDSFIVGLLTGYSVANNFTLSCISCAEPLVINNVNSTCKAIILDLRLITPSLIRNHLDSLQHIHQQFGTSVCVIRSRKASSPDPIPSWIDEYQCDDFVDNLDFYISKYISDTINAYYERRNKNRRMVADRRTLSTQSHPLSGPQANEKDYYCVKDVERYSVGDFEIDYSCRNVYLSGKNLELTCKEFKLFILLAEDFEHVCTTEKIIERLWPDTSRANKSDLYQYMHLLRKKVEQDPDNPHWILTVKGVGYKLQISEYQSCG